MFRSMPFLAVVVALAVCLGRPATALAVYPPPIKDDGKFFSKEAIEKANKKIRELYQKYKKDIIIETINTLTEEQEKKLKTESAKKFFGQLADARAKELGLNGLYIVITKKPRDFTQHADPESQKAIFTGPRRDKIFAAFRDQFREEKFDAGLLAGLDAIESALKSAK
jgi:hypothetical protein